MTEPQTPFPLAPGDRIRRTMLHEQFGGRRQGGISPSAVSPNVFLITDPDRGEAYGYLYDGRSTDGFYHYTGEGQVGDQQMTQGNRTVQDHQREGRALRLFRARGTELEYLGEFAYVNDYQAEAPDITGELRKVIVFRLQQRTGTPTGPTRARLDRLGHQRVKEVPIEQALTETTLIEGHREPYESERREQKLVHAFSARLERDGHDVCRFQFLPEGEAAPLFCDLFDKTTRTLYEAKGTVTRNAIRMAIGQLADYGRFVDEPRSLVILVPEEPRADLIALAASQGVGVTWP
jgi:hypothetical protein